MSAVVQERSSRAAHEPEVSPASPDKPIKVLYALDAFPQLSESYINAEIERMQEWGIDIEVWSRGNPKSACDTNVVVHRGMLTDKIKEVNPDIVHTHWTQSALKYKDAAKRAGIPMTARGHWHFVPKQLRRIEAEDTIVRLFMFPHLASKYGSLGGKILPMHSCFHPEWLAPDVKKNRKMVMRTAACKQPKDLATFIRIAKQMPDYRFVMILCSLGPNDHYRDLEQLNADLGNPIELIRDVNYDVVAKYMAEAGIYLHTYSPDVSFGMPVSIAEAMAAGCTIVARNVEGAADYVGDAGRLYNSEEEAIELIRATEQWSDEQWAGAERKSIQRATAEFDDRNVLRPLLDTWKELAAEQRAATGKSVPMFTRLRRWMGIGYKRI